MQQIGPFSPRYSVDVNDVVRHKPAMGTEIGLGILYKINHRLKLKTGLQYNVRKYYIDTYKSGLNIASIAIIRNNRLDTINQFSTLSANNGYAESQINSKLLQISVPVGIEYNLVQAKKFGINVAATIQPTLTLNKNVYLISTDYKYYTDGTSFFRKWNINSSFELNLTYQVGNFNWFLGTQARFQHLPTYNEKYPIKEYRMDYGLKFGFSKQLFK
ncbi:MAG: outer membrane beta-barrel protein [Chitinophagaceae bacterium]